MLELSGAAAVVTGGAGGLGRAMSEQLAGAGARVALWDLDGKAAEEAAAAIVKRGGKARGYAVDVTSRRGVREAAQDTEAALGPVDLLINNAGIVSAGDLVDADEDALDRTVDVNLKSYLWCTRAFLPGMISRGRGHVVLIASAAGLLGVPGMAVYSASKHGVVGLGESLRLELKARSSPVGVTIVCPCFINTGMFDGANPPWITPWLEPGEVAEAVVGAVRSGRSYVRAPFMVKLVPLLKALPLPLLDLLGELTGMHRAMQGFRGKTKREER